MNPAPRKIPVAISIGLLLTLLALLLAYLLTGLQSRASRSQHLRVIGTVNDFTLTNQTGAASSLADLRGRVWIADIIFTRCPGPCLKMTRQMKELQDALPVAGKNKLVTLTTDPEFDTPPVLAKYAARFDADTNRWMFLTGTKKEIGALAAGGLKLSAVEVKPAERQSENDLFIHSTIFVVVDKQARLRGVFETSGEDVNWQTEKQKILAAVKQLEREP
jgi:protein SCO1/2